MERIPSAKKVVLIGTFIDERLRVVPENPSVEEVEELMDQMVDVSSEDRIVSLMDQFKNIVGSLEVSCTLKANVGLALSLAYSAVKHPREPLIENDQLSKVFKNALRRIFYLLDKDGDGRLNEEELKAYRRVALGESDNVDEAIAITVQKMKEWKEWSLGGVTYNGWERAFEELIFDRGSVWSVWTALNHFGYNTNFKYVYPKFRMRKTMDPRTERLSFSKSGLAFIIQLHGRLRVLSGGCPMNNVRALLAMIPQPILDATPHWSNYDDIASGEVVVVAGNGISLSSFVALWNLLLERNEFEFAVAAHRIGFILGYDSTEEPFVEIQSRETSSYHRILIYGSGKEARSKVIRGVVLGAVKNVDELMNADRRVVSSGKIESMYISSFAPSRLPNSHDLNRFDLMIVPFDEETEVRSFMRAGNGALACRDVCDILFVCTSASAKNEERLAWLNKRKISTIYDVNDTHQLREEILRCLKGERKSRLVATEEDIALEKKRNASKNKISNSTRKNMFLVLVLILVLLLLLVFPSLLADLTGVPSSVLSVTISVVGAFALVKLME
jgi:hypothetical protein